MAQLELDLDDVRRRVPWGGVQPRVLTRGYAQFIFKAQAVKKTSDSVDADQLPLFPGLVRKAPWVYQGAPLLQEV